MAGPDAVCPVHGIFTVNNVFGGNGAVSATFADCAANCPRCGAMSPIVDGTYEFVGEVLKGFRAPGVTLENIEAFRDLLLASQSGSITEQQAREGAAKFGASFASLLDSAKKNEGILNVSITIIGLFIAGYAVHSSDQSSAQQHEDAQQQKVIQQKIYEELTRTHLSDTPQATSTPPKQAMQQKFPSQMPKAAAHNNRHERRKAACLARRQPRS